MRGFLSKERGLPSGFGGSLWVAIGTLQSGLLMLCWSPYCEGKDPLLSEVPTGTVSTALESLCRTQISPMLSLVGIIPNFCKERRVYGSGE